jgi:hypothetical protein
MAKDNTQSIPVGAIPTANTVAPLFALARTVLEEVDRESDRWIEYGLAQTREAAEVARTIRNQTVGITRTVLGTIEHSAASALDAAQSFAKPFVKVGA